MEGLGGQPGRKYRLLSEAEWEYAARAGTTTPFSTGQRISTEEANFGFERGKTMTVGSFSANRFGLHDMHGNVMEWVEDCYRARYRGAPTDGSARTSGKCSLRVLRGGAWNFDPSSLRSAFRDGFSADIRGSNVGFRVARMLSP